MSLTKKSDNKTLKDTKMFGGGGSIQGMITSLKNNKKLLRSKKLFSKERNFLNTKKENLKATEGKLEFKEASKEELERVRNRIINQRKKERLIFIFVTIAVVGAFTFFAIQLIQQNRLAEEQQKTLQQKAKEKEFLFFLKNGDDWFEKAKWQNSIFYYKKAKSISPTNYEVNYRLVNSYSLQCEHEFKNCHTAKDLLEELFVKFPDKTKDLLVIKSRLEYEY